MDKLSLGQTNLGKAMRIQSAQSAKDGQCRSDNEGGVPKYLVSQQDGLQWSYLRSSGFVDQQAVRTNLQHIN